MTKGLKGMRYLFNEMGLTHYGGMLLINSLLVKVDFCKKLGLKRLLQTYVEFPKRGGTYLSHHCRFRSRDWYTSNSQIQITSIQWFAS